MPTTTAALLVRPLISVRNKLVDGISWAIFGEVKRHSNLDYRFATSQCVVLIALLLLPVLLVLFVGTPHLSSVHLFESVGESVRSQNCLFVGAFEVCKSGL